jgi:hypothetical protein
MNQTSRGLPPLIALIVMLTACSGAGADPGVSSEHAAQVKQICKDVMGFSPGEAHFMGCVESLQQTLVQIDHADATQRDRETCQTRGLRIGTAEFATCVVGLEQAPATTGHAS